MRPRFIVLFSCLSLLISTHTIAQSTPADSSRHQLEISGYVDVYAAYFSDSLGANTLQQYTTVSPRSNRFGLNVAQVGLHYTSDRVRGNVILHYGDIMQATWSEEFRFVQEANVGIRLGKRLWLDAGFFGTHIGAESFLPKNIFTSSTTLATFNEPFFQSGAKLSYQAPSERFYGELWVVSGYNFFLDVNDAKSVGVLLNYNLSPKLSLTYTNLLGRESLDDIDPTQFRTYHNLYLSGNFDKWQFVVGADLGTQTNSDLANPEEGAILYNALLTIRRQWSQHWATTLRGEIFSDESGFISGIPSGQTEGLQAWGITGSVEYSPMEDAYLRFEGRYLQSPEDLRIFYDGNPTNNRLELMVMMGFAFNRSLGK